MMRLDCGLQNYLPLRKEPVGLVGGGLGVERFRHGGMIRLLTCILGYASNESSLKS